MMPKIMDLSDVRGGESALGFPVQIHADDDTGRLQIRGVNEGGFACVDIDLMDLLTSLAKLAPGSVDGGAIEFAITTRKHPE
ncbi:MAG: hypothetical protein ABL996_21065 [Micropepsaceae bacterium]